MKINNNNQTSFLIRSIYICIQMQLTRACCLPLFAYSLIEFYIKIDLNIFIHRNLIQFNYSRILLLHNYSKLNFLLCTYEYEDTVKNLIRVLCHFM